MEILYDIPLRDPYALQYLGAVLAKDRGQFSTQVLRKAIRFVEGHINSGHLPVLGDEYQRHDTEYRESSCPYPFLRLGRTLPNNWSKSLLILCDRFSKRL